MEAEEASGPADAGRSVRLRPGRGAEGREILGWSFAVEVCAEPEHQLVTGRWLAIGRAGRRTRHCAGLCGLANERRRFGCRRRSSCLRREGEPSDISRIQRLYRERGSRCASCILVARPSARGRPSSRGEGERVPVHRPRPVRRRPALSTFGETLSAP
jgi:hypothetical protein